MTFITWTFSLSDFWWGELLWSSLLTSNKTSHQRCRIVFVLSRLAHSNSSELDEFTELELELEIFLYDKLNSNLSFSCVITWTRTYENMTKNWVRKYVWLPYHIGHFPYNFYNFICCVCHIFWLFYFLHILSPILRPFWSCRRSYVFLLSLHFCLYHIQRYNSIACHSSVCKLVST